MSAPQSAEKARLQGPPIEGAHAIWCTPDNPCAGGLCDGTVERFIRNEGGPSDEFPG